MGDPYKLVVPPGYVTTGQLAKMIGKHIRTVRRWTDSGALGYHPLVMGDLTIRIFDLDQQKRAQRLARYSQGWTLEERHAHMRTNADGSRRQVRKLPPGTTIKEKL